MGTWSLSSPSGVVPRVRFFSAGSPGSSLSLEPENRRSSLPIQKGNREFELTALTPTSLKDPFSLGL